MKKIKILGLLFISTLTIIKAQNDTIYIHYNDEVVYKRAIINIDSITFHVDTVESFICGTIFTDSRDSKAYSTVLIGSQCWMAENLNYGTYVTVATGQSGANTQKYCYSDNTANCTTYGGLYEWAEIMNGSSSSNSNPSGIQGICPSGWHLPSDLEWIEMEDTLGMCTGVGAGCSGATAWRGTNEGGKLKEAGTTHWAPPNECSGTCNTSGFMALPGGFSLSGSFNNVASNGFWWSSTEYNATFAWFRTLSYSVASVYRLDYNRAYGFSVRCIKD